MFGLHEYFGFFPLFRLTRPTQSGGGGGVLLFIAVL